ncbi:MFS transporter [Streptomyces tubbatahanensis]|uniref:MFS transporter n=1 Tax=Streptomyces tubbatahanensis TaxID=2923272 RepID=A0ABY3XX33_9ACTN|nr:MFS transporter [Streptomyces tubbatahanensis]UNS98930.1 MFS transporter [Streptomyces tubbatahanensis]
MTGYRQILAVPGMAPLLAVSFLARIAITADVMALTLYVVLGLELSYAAAGGVAAALTAGLALGGSLLGRVLDRRGLRPVLLLTVAAQAVFWLSVPVLPYGALVGAALVAGLLMVPAQPVTRQAIAAMTTARQRRAAFALEAVQGELSYMVGPAVVILCAARLPPGAVAWGLGAAIVAGGTGIALLDPPLRAEGGSDLGPGTGAEARTGRAAERPPRREWLGARMIAVLTMACGTTMLLGGVDLALVATLEAAGQVSWASVVVAVLGVASVVGGLIHGALSRSLPTWSLLGLLGLVTIPAGLAHQWPWLCVAVACTGFFAAPTLSAVTDAVSRLAPAGVRGEATGLQSAAQSAGLALGSPLVGVAVDVSAPAGGFAAAGLAGLAAALTGRLLSRHRPSPGPSAPAGHQSGTGVRGPGPLPPGSRSPTA